MDLMKLKSVPKGNYTNFVSINDKEFITAVRNGKDEEINPAFNGIIAYNTITDEWGLLIPYPPQLTLQWGSVSFNPTTNTVSIVGGSNNQLIFAMFDLLTKKCDIIRNCFDIGSSFSHTVLLCIDGKHHAFSGFDNNDHLVYNEENKEFEKIFTFSGFRSGVESHSVIYSKQRNTIHLLGGYDWGVGYNKEVWRCEIKSDNKYEWKKWEKSHGYTMYGEPCILTPDEKYIIIFMSKGIFYIDVETEKIDGLGKSLLDDMKVNHAILCNGIKDEILVNGYVKRVSKEIDIMVPNELVSLLSQYYCTQDVHFICGDHSHYMIPFCDILSVRLESLPECD